MLWQVLQEEVHFRSFRGLALWSMHVTEDGTWSKEAGIVFSLGLRYYVDDSKSHVFGIIT